MVELVDNKGAPPELIYLADEAASKCSKVNKVIFDAFIKELDDDLGAFDPVQGIIIIDMGACVLKKAWMEKGIMFIPNVWLNLVFTFFHEMAHALQLEENPSLAELDVLPSQYEIEANAIAENSLLSWVKDHTTPRLNELGWVGDQIKELFNKLYAQIPQAIIDEMAVEGTEAVANALHVVLASGQYEDKEDRAKLLKSIDEGLIGIRVNKRRYFTAYEAINMNYSQRPAAFPEFRM